MEKFSTGIYLAKHGHRKLQKNGRRSVSLAVYPAAIVTRIVAHWHSFSSACKTLAKKTSWQTQWFAHTLSQSDHSLMTFYCFSCQHPSDTPIHYPCSQCGADLSHLDGTALNSWQQDKWDEHTTLVSGNNVPLLRKGWNCSFDVVGHSKIQKLVEFTLNYGNWYTVNSREHTNDVCITFIPEIIGSGVSRYTTVGPMPVSGCCIISPRSLDYGHPFPVLSDWVISKFGSIPSHCRLCGKPTIAGISVCWDCYSAAGNDWTTLL